MTTLRTALVVFDEVDVLDFCGPLEVLHHTARTGDPFAPPSDRLFDPVIIASTPAVHCASPLTVQRHMSIADARQQIQDWDLVIVPGGPPTTILDLAFERDEAGAGKEIMAFLREYTQVTKAAGSRNRVLMSVCTGALFLGKLGVMAGTSATTHHMAFDHLEKLVDGQGTKVLTHKRWVDGGLIGPRGADGDGDEKKDLRLVTAGGVSSGLDASMYLISILGNLDIADQASAILEYRWRPENDGVSFS